MHLLAADVPLIGAQPPLPAGRMSHRPARDGRRPTAGHRLLRHDARGTVDLVVTLGNSKTPLRGREMISLNAGDWDGSLLSPRTATRWRAGEWPLGGMAAAAMAATEAFKIAMRKLERHARNRAMMMEMFAPSADVEFAVAPGGTSIASELGEFDCVSGGAITQSALFALTRLPGFTGTPA